MAKGIYGCCILVLLFAGPLHIHSQTSSGLTVKVTDTTGAPISGSVVSLTDNAKHILQQTTNSDGLVSFQEILTASIKLVVTATGFANSEHNLSAIELERSVISIVLLPASISEQVVVSAARTETRVSETAASVAVLTSSDLASSGALKLDDALRQVVGFSLFRRSSSRVANPTTQGVSMRGVGASGASRALVLEDGLPLNDPFGGWVYWSRVPRASVSSVEVIRGGASSLYGTDALGGVINVVTRQPSERTLSLDLSYGNERTPDGSFFAAARKGKWGASLAGEVFRTDGYILVDRQLRGTIDIPANVKQSSVELNLERSIGRHSRAFLRGSFFDEARSNGTPLQTNATHIREISGGADFAVRGAGDFTFRFFTETGKLDQNFTAVSADRTSESLTRVQRAPSQGIGAAFQWTRSIGKHTIIAGAETRSIRGASNELAFVLGQPTSFVDAGGREHFSAVFAEDIIRVTSQLILTLNARFDDWSNFRGQSLTRSIKTSLLTSSSFFPDRRENAVSPHVSIAYSPHGPVSFAASFYKAFRAPTLNELYRSFRVGDVLTLANADLRAERLAGGEAGATVKLFDGRFTTRATVFLTDISNPVTNATISSAPGLITRKRENLGVNRANGVETEAEAIIAQRWTVTAGYLFVDSTIKSFPANRSLEGLWVPQVPRQQVTFQVRYASSSGLVAALQGRASGSQFDDDLNLFRLRPYLSLDGFISRKINRRAELYVAAENLLTKRYDVGLSPIRTIGPPLIIRGGLRVNLGFR